MGRFSAVMDKASGEAEAAAGREGGGGGERAEDF
jgi:hypothetical protein